MNLKKQIKFATLLAFTSNDHFIQESQQAHVVQKDINISGIFSKISNLQLVAFDKREGDEESNKQPENLEMLQLEKGDTVKNFALNGDDMNDVMMDSFKQEKESSADKQEQDDQQQNQQQQSDAPQDESESMTIVEQMAHVKKQTTQALQQIKKDQEEAEAKKKAQEKKNEEEKKKQLEEQKRKANFKALNADSDEMDNYVDQQLKKQKEDRERYDRDILGCEPEQEEPKPKAKKNVDELIKQHKQKEEKEGSNDDDSNNGGEHKKSFKSADEALEHFGQSIAQRQLEISEQKDQVIKEQDAQEVHAKNAAKEAKDKKVREEKEKKEKEEKSIRDALQKEEDERKERLLTKLQSLGGASEEAVPQATAPGFLHEAAAQKQSESESKQQKLEEEEDKEKERKAKKAQEEAQNNDPEEARKSRLQEKLDSFQMLDDGGQSEPAPEAPAEKQASPAPEGKPTAKAVAAKPPAEASVQTQKEVHVRIEAPAEEVPKSQQFSSLVEQVEKEQQVKAAKARADVWAKEERERQKSLQDQEALQKELDNEKAAQMAKQQQEIAMLAQQSIAIAPPLAAAPVALPSFSSQSFMPSFTSPPSPSAAETTPSSSGPASGQTGDKKFDIHRLIRDAVQHNTLGTTAAAPTPAPKPSSALALPALPLLKKVPRPIVSLKAKPVVIVKPVIKVAMPKVAKKAAVVVTPPTPPAPVAPIAPIAPPTPVVASTALATIEAQAPTDAESAEPAGVQVSQERLDAKLQKELAETGVKAPSDITRALIDDSTDEQLSGHGFFGKYLKKHRDMKKKAHDELLKEDLELQARKERLKKEMSERIKADAPVSTQGGVIQKKRKKKTLSERAHQKLIDEQNTKDAEAQEKAQMVVQVSQLAQLPNAGQEINLAPRSEGTL